MKLVIMMVALGLAALSLLSIEMWFADVVIRAVAKDCIPLGLNADASNTILQALSIKWKQMSGGKQLLL